MPSGSAPFGITVGPDGALWFTELLAERLGRIPMNDAIQELDMPGSPPAVVADPGGARVGVRVARAPLMGSAGTVPAADGRQNCIPAFVGRRGVVGSGNAQKGVSAVLLRSLAVATASVLSGLLTAPSSAAEPETDPVQPVAAETPLADAVPVGDGRVESPPPQVIKTPDGWTLTLSAKDETQTPNAPLTTALSSREYTVAGTFNGRLSGPADGEDPAGTIEVGYQIGCGVKIDGRVGQSFIRSYAFLTRSTKMSDAIVAYYGTTKTI